MISAIAESSPDSILLLDRDQRVRFTNRAIPGETTATVRERSVYDFVPDDQQATVRACFARVQASRTADRYDCHKRVEDGTVHTFESRVAPVLDGGELRGFVVFSSDVTERRAAAAERDRLFDLSLDMLCVAAPDGYFKRLNPAWSDVLGYETAELLAAPFSDFVHPQDRVETAGAMATLIAHGNVTNFQNRYRTKDGSYRRLSWFAVRDQDTGLFYCVARDVTHERSLNEQIREAQKMDAVGKLAGGIAHEFNNLMLSILVNTEFAFEDLTEGHPVLEHLNQIERAGQRAAGLTKQLLAFSRRQPLELKRIDLGEVVRRLFPLLERLVEPRAALTLTTGPRVGRAPADASQVEQVVVNLCVNASDSLVAKGEVSIEVARTQVEAAWARDYHGARAGDFVRLSVVDDGPGMEPEVVARIFEPFFTTKPAGEGTGLGLSTVYGIVKQHRGFIVVDSEPGAGTRFEVYFPAD